MKELAIAPVLRLPDELLISIVGNLKFEDKKRLSLVSRRFNGVVAAQAHYAPLLNDNDLEIIRAKPFLVKRIR